MNKKEINNIFHHERQLQKILDEGLQTFLACVGIAMVGFATILIVLAIFFLAVAVLR